MAGYNLKEGLYTEGDVSEDELWGTFAYALSSKSRNTSSYKFGFLKSIIDNLYNVDENLILSFDQIFSKFSEIYWNLIFKHNLRQKAITADNKETYLEQIFYAIADKNQILEPIPYESIGTKIADDVSHQIKIKCKRYVVGALFEDTNKLFYSFSKNEEWIQINPIMYNFICKHKLLIEKLNYYEWAKFLEKVNTDKEAVRLLNKLDESTKRNNLAHYRQILYEEFEVHTCFYCGKVLNPNKIHVDHFIPWSFVKDDNLWNLVLACPNCNWEKNDRLPKKKYLNELIDRNKNMISELFDEVDLNNQGSKLSNIYEWAMINGYDRLWNPKKSSR